MPYRGPGSGIIRALQEEPNIKFINEPVGMQFISVINRIADEGVNEGEGKTKAKFDKDLQDEHNEYLRRETEYHAKIPQLVIEYRRRARGYYPG